MIATLPLLRQANGVAIDVEYDDLTNAMTGIIISNSFNGRVDFTVIDPVLGGIPLDTSLGVSRKTVLAPGMVWKAVSNRSGEPALCWPDGYGFEALIAPRIAAAAQAL